MDRNKEPIIRIYAEAEKKQEASILIKRAKKIIV